MIMGIFFNAKTDLSCNSKTGLIILSSFSTTDLPVHVADLVVEGQEGDWRLDGLPALGTQPDDLQAGLVYLLGQLIHGDVTGSTHQDWST